LNSIPRFISGLRASPRLPNLSVDQLGQLAQLDPVTALPDEAQPCAVVAYLVHSRLRTKLPSHAWRFLKGRWKKKQAAGI